MRPIISFFCCLLLHYLVGTSGAYAGDSSPGWASLSLRSSLGVSYGMVSELVYADRVLLSRLDWQLWQTTYQQQEIEAVFPFDLFARGRFRTYFPSISGFLEDRDYLNGDGVATHYSRNDAYLDGGIFAELTFGMRFRLLEAFMVGPVLGLNRLELRWHAEGGYYQYPMESIPPYSAWDSGSPHFPLYGTSINYRLDSSFYTLGLQGSFAILDLTFDLGFMGSWGMGAEDDDTHFRREVVFSDRYKGGQYFHGSAQITYKVAGTLQVFLSSDFRRLWGFDGEISTLAMNSGEAKSAAAGFSSGLDGVLVDWGIGIRFEN